MSNGSPGSFWPPPLLAGVRAREGGCLALGLEKHHPTFRPRLRLLSLGTPHPGSPTGICLSAWPAPSESASESASESSVQPEHRCPSPWPTRGLAWFHPTLPGCDGPPPCWLVLATSEHARRCRPARLPCAYRYLVTEPCLRSLQGHKTPLPRFPWRLLPLSGDASGSSGTRNNLRRVNTSQYERPRHAVAMRSDRPPAALVVKYNMHFIIYPRPCSSHRPEMKYPRRKENPSSRRRRSV